MSISSSFFSNRLHHWSIYLKKRSQVIAPFFRSALISRRWNTFYLWRKRKRERRRRKSVWRSIRCEQRATGARDPWATIRNDMEPTTGSSEGYINNHWYTSIERHPLFFIYSFILTKRDCLKMFYTLYTAVSNLLFIHFKVIKNDKYTREKIRYVYA